MDPQVEIRGCRSRKELQEVVELCDEAFDDTAREYFERHMFKDGTISQEDTRVLVRGGSIVSSVQVFPRTIYMGEKKVRMGGIGNVATLPSERKKGYAEQVMRDAMEFMRQKGFLVSLLTTTINDYYKRFGFQTLNRRLVKTDVIPRQDQSHIEVFDFSRDAAQVMRLYDSDNAKNTGPIVRDADYWRSQIDFCGEDPKLFLVWRDGEEILGYVRGRKETGSTKILEYAFANGREEIPRALFADLAYRAGQPKLDVFVSRTENKRLSLLQSRQSEVDTYFMAAFFGDGIDDRTREGILTHNDFTFWLTDYF